ncbi:MAG: hypothetical protein ACRDOH_32355 [Streptosporangiaceae bacterium]
MIGMQLLYGVLVAMAALAAAAIVLLAATLAATFVAKPGPPPHGGIRRDLPPQPQPDTDDARTLVLR